MYITKVKIIELTSDYVNKFPKYMYIQIGNFTLTAVN